MQHVKNKTRNSCSIYKLKAMFGNGCNASTALCDNELNSSCVVGKFKENVKEIHFTLSLLQTSVGDNVDVCQAIQA